MYVVLSIVVVASILFTHLLYFNIISFLIICIHLYACTHARNALFAISL